MVMCICISLWYMCVGKLEEGIIFFEFGIVGVCELYDLVVRKLNFGFLRE